MTLCTALKPFSAVATVMAAIALLCFCGLTVRSQAAMGGYRPRPPLSGGGGRGFGGRGPIPYVAGGRIPGRLGQGVQGLGGQGPGMRGPGSLMAAMGPGPVIVPGLTGPGGQMGGPQGGAAQGGGPLGGTFGGGNFDFSSASRWSNFGPSHQYPSVPMGNLQGQPGAAPGAEPPSGEEATGGAVAEDPSAAAPSNELFNYMVQNEDSLSNQAPSSSWYANNLSSSESSESAVEGMGIEDNSNEKHDEREQTEDDARSPKEIDENNGFMAKREEDSKKERKEEAKSQDALKAKKELAHREELKEGLEKKEEAKKEALKKEEAKKEEAKKEEAKNEEANKEAKKGELKKEVNKTKADEALEKEEAHSESEPEKDELSHNSGIHKLKSHKTESHEEESYKEESHEEEHKRV